MTLGYKGGAGTLLMDGKIYCFDRTAHVDVEKKVMRRLSVGAKVRLDEKYRGIRQKTTLVR
jgi:hypothetical protein